MAQNVVITLKIPLELDNAVREIVAGLQTMHRDEIKKLTAHPGKEPEKAAKTLHERGKKITPANLIRLALAAGLAHLGKPEVLLKRIETDPNAFALGRPARGG